MSSKQHWEQTWLPWQKQKNFLKKDFLQALAVLHSCNISNPLSPTLWSIFHIICHLWQCLQSISRKQPTMQRSSSSALAQQRKQKHNLKKSSLMLTQSSPLRSFKHCLTAETYKLKPLKKVSLTMHLTLVAYLLVAEVLQTQQNKL